NCSADELKCVVFMVEHNSSQHGVKPHKGMMMSVAELERMTGHTFFPNVPNAPKDSYNASDWGF
ncbi:MAG: DNA/RNA non-specific endonuclease, partial [Tidjanibacter sp.]|nr:DNA/RNA non-specific endonuclease [Tidjanibacter sp.]